MFHGTLGTPLDLPVCHFWMWMRRSNYMDDNHKNTNDMGETVSFCLILLTICVVQIINDKHTVRSGESTILRSGFYLCK